MVGALGSETGFAISMLNVVISMMHVLLYHKNSKLQLSGLKKTNKKQHRISCHHQQREQGNEKLKGTT